MTGSITVPAGWTARPDDCILPGCSGDAARTPTLTRALAGDLAGPAAPSAAEVLAAIADVLTEWLGGEYITIDVVDHTAGRRDPAAPAAVTRVVVSADGPCGLPPEDGPAARVRYEHFGTLADPLPVEGPVSQHSAVTARAHIKPCVLSVYGTVVDGRPCLDWWCGPQLCALLREGDVPQRVADVLSRVRGAVT
ncbi:hypothetical protein Sme01_52590 [Sphaerisporangium melleum]|uniref:Uncharacterized protein n=1 Tax=Sphaerisporangium melleum TaxID=321316 RepID=A0A917VKR0_9ACTN|nr:hypothetical protein [Sphaerisporangium melleum]GGK91065.1 hypothetical protein GCM10007964_37150 [Sphaerisporangium melleum]GII72783.1 hypothetical protein Sme01_52590 [Sphaerisporangium melleum]